MTSSVEATLAVFRLLGPLRLLEPSERVDLGPGKQQCLLAALLLAPGQSVPAETLVDRIWGDHPPRQPRRALASYASRLRRALPSADAAALRYVSGGYLLNWPQERIDLFRVRRLVSQARRSDDQFPVAALLREALSDWQPVALAGIPGDWAERVRDSLNRERLEAYALWADAELNAGHPEDVADTLGSLTNQHPTAEVLVAQLMRALVRCGRANDSLSCYERLREALDKVRGVEPSAELVRLHHQILRGAGVAVEVGSPAPAQLPTPPAALAGREDYLAELDAVAVRPGPTTAVIAGIAGVGKTALTTYWAQKVAGDFPDGQLYLDLRGFGPAQRPVSPTETVRQLLNALGVAPQRVPATLDAQLGLYRTLLAGRRVLVILDNARDAEQVRSLLPGAAGCLTVVTSRGQLPGLVAAEGVHWLTLDTLSTVESRQLLIGRLGSGRVLADPAGTDDIISRCVGLPLALGLAAAHACARPGMRLAAIVEDLGTDAGLDTASTEDGATKGRPSKGSVGMVSVADVRAVFSCSYGALSADATTMFRRLGVFPGPDLPVTAAASIAAVSLSQARQALDELSRAELVTEHRPGRYVCHDLLRGYAAELAQAGGETTSARHRILDHYLHTGHAAAMLLAADRAPLRLAMACPGVTPVDLADREAALAWFSAEHQILLAAVDQAAGAGMDTHTWQLAWTMVDFLDSRGHWHDWVTVERAALDAACRLGDRPGQAHAHRVLGRGYVQIGACEEGRTHYHRALELYGALTDVAGQAHTHFSLSGLADQQNQTRQATRHAQQALRLYDQLGHPRAAAVRSRLDQVHQSGAERVPE